MERFDWITREGYERLRSELDQLVAVERPRIAQWLRQAREDGGEPGDNSDLAAALRELDAVEGRITELEHTLDLSRIAEPPEPGVAGIGSYVHVDSPGGPRLVLRLVGAAEVEPGRGCVSVDSPVGRALIGQKKGDKVSVQLPNGTERELTIQKIEVGG